MAFAPRVCLVLGSVLLVHAAYSAYEHSHLTSKSPASSPELQSSLPASSGVSSLPLDITIETLVSVLLLCVAIVGMSEELKPISWRVWAGEIEKKVLQGKEDELQDIDGFRWLDAGKRRGFLDIRAQRKDFAEWAKGEKKL